MAAALRLNEAWNAVSIEERLQLITQAKAYGLLVSVCSVFLVGSVAYGFDNIYLLVLALLAGSISMPLSAGRFWRRTKSELVLTYLAVRSVSRRYAYAYRIPAIDIVLIFRGEIETMYSSEEEKVLARESEQVDFDSTVKGKSQVWICLLRGALVVLSEKRGGAKLETIIPITGALGCRKPTAEETSLAHAVVISDPTKGKNYLISSSYRGALYVFEKRVARLIYETVAQKEQLEKKRLQEIEDKKKLKHLTL